MRNLRAKEALAKPPPQGVVPFVLPSLCGYKGDAVDDSGVFWLRLVRSGLVVRGGGVGFGFGGFFELLGLGGEDFLGGGLLLGEPGVEVFFAH